METVEPPTKSKMRPKLGTDSAMNKAKATRPVLRATRFHPNSIF